MSLFILWLRRDGKKEGEGGQPCIALTLERNPPMGAEGKITPRADFIWVLTACLFCVSSHAVCT
jgi:hypothetical protein